MAISAFRLKGVFGSLPRTWQLHEPWVLVEPEQTWRRVDEVERVHLMITSLSHGQGRLAHLDMIWSDRRYRMTGVSTAADDSFVHFIELAERLLVHLGHHRPDLAIDTGGGPLTRAAYLLMGVSSPLLAALLWWQRPESGHVAIALGMGGLSMLYLGNPWRRHRRSGLEAAQLLIEEMGRSRARPVSADD
ncbi:MAG: hypothetical protein AAGD35_05155 [Actinomycetota bacterium]